MTVFRALNQQAALPFASLRDFGAIGADATAAFRAAAAAGRPVLVPWRDTPYILTGQVDLASGTVFVGEPGARPTIQLVSASTARMFDANGRTNCGLVGLRLDGGQISTTGVMVRFRDTTAPFMDDCEVVNAPAWASGGTVTLSGTTTRAAVRRCRFEDCDAQAAVYLTGTGVSECRVEDCEFRACAGFGIFADNGVHRCIFSRNFTHTTAKEGIGITHPCSYCRIVDNHCEASGDNGISVSGMHNICSGNMVLNNDFAGIGVWGSFNVVLGNVIVNNDQILNGDWAGVWIGNGYGGTAQNNTIIGNITDDNQATPTQRYGVRIKGNAYAAWTQGATYASGAYVVHGLNIYRATTAGTAGATAPTHTDGAVSDGGVTWAWTNAHRVQATPRTNMVIFNTPGRVASGGSADSDVSTWANNMVYGYATNVRVNWPTAAAGLQSGQIWRDAAAGNVLKVA